MKTIYMQKVAVVASDTPQGFEAEMNRRLEELSESRPRIRYNMNQGFCAYIDYEVAVRVAEDLRDEYEMRGEGSTCAECPYLEKSDDGRRKWQACKVQGRTHEDNPACLYYYRQLEKGEL